MNSEVSQLLIAWRQGGENARNQLMPLVYQDLHALAGRYCRSERQITLQPTAIIHEAFLRLVGSQVPWNGRTHFFAISASMIRRILIDEARKRKAAKRGAGCWIWRSSCDIDIQASRRACQHTCTAHNRAPV